MTLVTRPKPPAHHKKFSGHHHRRSKDYHKPYWPYLPIALIVAAGLVFNVHAAPKHGVLAYATDMSIQELLSGTNDQRNANGLGSLNLSNLLDQAAQNKANDMVNRDYWSHETPDGQTPWSFYDAVGYHYQTAGENLAYGFTTPGSTIDAWMNSPGHRANILNTTYSEVGFGVANSPNYQGSGPETVVVAEYALPIGGSSPAAPVSSTPTPTSTPSATASAPASAGASASASASGGSGGGAATPATSDTPSAAGSPASSNQSKTVTTASPVKPIVETKAQPVSRLELLTAGKAPWSVTALTILLASGMLIFFTRHGIAWHRVIRKGERFFLKHPALDIAATLIIVIGLLLTRSVGSIR